MTLLRPTPCYLVYHKSYLVERYFRGFCGLALDAHNNIQPGPGLGWLSHGARVNWSKICEHGDHTQVLGSFLHPGTHTRLYIQRFLAEAPEAG